jgi:hypothetical protein
MDITIKKKKNIKRRVFITAIGINILSILKDNIVSDLTINYKCRQRRKANS